MRSESAATSKSEMFTVFTIQNIPTIILLIYTRCLLWALDRSKRKKVKSNCNDLYNHHTSREQSQAYSQLICCVKYWSHKIGTATAFCWLLLLLLLFAVAVIPVYMWKWSIKCRRNYEIQCALHNLTSNRKSPRNWIASNILFTSLYLLLRFFFIFNAFKKMCSAIPQQWILNIGTHNKR